MRTGETDGNAESFRAEEAAGIEVQRASPSLYGIFGQFLAERGEQAVFAVTLRSEKTLIGSVGLKIHREDRRAELGYWIGRPYWNQGYCTEAARAALEFGFRQLGLNRLFAHHFARNPASGRVLQKIGMTREGRLPQHVRKWDAFEDLELYGVLKGQWRH